MKPTSPGAAVVMLGLMLVCTAMQAAAQAPTFGSNNRPGSSRPTLPALKPPSAGSTIELPPIGAPSEPGGEAAGARVFVRSIRIVGNTVLTEDDFKPVLAPYLNRELTSNDLQAVRDALTRLYVQQGYINSGAVIPDQDVADGIVTYRIVEGRLREIDIQGSKYLARSYLIDRLSDGDDKPLHVPSLERKMQLLLQDPLIKRLNAELGPGLRPGEARLRVEVEDGRQFALETLVANDRSPGIGAEHGAVRLTARNVSGHADPLSLELNATEGQRDVAVDYSFPLTRYDTRAHLHASYYDSSVVDPDFKPLDIDSTAENVEIGISHPVIRTPRTQLRLGGYFVNRWSRTTLLGEPFSFSPGVVDGETKLTILRFTQEFVDRTGERVIAARSTVSLGLDALGATDAGVEPNATYLAWLGQLQYLRRINDWLDVLCRADVQLASDPLFSIEQYALGGVDTVRGYRENLLVRDNAVDASLELRFTVAHLPLPVIADKETDGAVQLAPFFDFGRAWSAGGGGGSSDELASVGIGLRWQPFARMQAELYWGYKILHPSTDATNETLQDHGIHFRVSTRLY